ncbi:MAG: NAD-dependent epimerase/dehydratase family protein [Nitrospira sp.]|nr:NAD-dependent epimerase/dehydratase family protein [Nitrospira sp.]
MPSKVLVTGAAGFIGRHVARRFSEAGWSVIGLGHGTWSFEEARSWGIEEWHAADISFDALSALVAVPDALVHCAGSGTVGYSLSHPYQDFQRSAGTAAAVLEYVRLRAPLTRLVLLSSAAVYGQGGTEAVREDGPLNPVSPYGVHKMFGEMLCRMYGAQYGVSSAVVRFFSVYGDNLRKQLLWDACNRAASGDLTFAGSGEETRDWLHVMDAAELLFTAVEYASSLSPVVNGGTGDSPTIAEVLEVLFYGLGIHEKPVFSGMARQGDPLHYRADVDAARRWGWRSKVGWRDGVRAYAQWFKARRL